MKISVSVSVSVSFEEKEMRVFTIALALALTLTLFLYPERELNPHNHYWSQDFKSCVSTNSTIRAGLYADLLIG